jgi:drug/metabolite transporter (DMT)-like permease
MKKIYLLALIPVILWSTAFIGVKSGLAYATPMAFAGIRFMLAGILLAIVIHDPKGLLSHTKRHWPLVLKTSVLQTSLFYALYYYGIDQVPASIAAIIVGSIPLFSAVTAHLFLHNDALTGKKIASILAAIGGIVLISVSRNPSTEVGKTQVLGIVLLLIAAVCESFLQVVLKKNTDPYDPMKLNSAQIFIGGATLFIISIPVEGMMDFALPGTFYWSLLYLSMVSAVGFSIWYSLIQRPEVLVSNLNMLKFLNPVLGAGLSWIVMANDSPDPFSVAGMLIISAAVLLFYAKRRR